MMFFENSELYEKAKNRNYTGHCLHCKIILKRLKRGKGKAHLGTIKNKGIIAFAMSTTRSRLILNKHLNITLTSSLASPTKKVSTDAATANFFYNNAVAFEGVENDSFEVMCNKLAPDVVKYKPLHRGALSTALIDNNVESVECFFALLVFLVGVTCMS